MIRLFAVLAAAGISMAAPATELSVPLVFSPQEAVATQDLPSLPPSLLDTPLAVQLTDARGTPGNAIGTGTNDDDQPFTIVATSSPRDFVDGVTRRLMATMGVQTSNSAERQLELRLSSFDVEERNQAFGSTYRATVAIGFVVKQHGAVLHEGATRGEANRFGASASPANIAEVLSDATKESLAAVISDPLLHIAWGTGAKPVKAGEEPIESKLAKLDELLKAGHITAEEHRAARAKALEGL